MSFSWNSRIVKIAKQVSYLIKKFNFAFKTAIYNILTTNSGNMSYKIEQLIKFHNFTSVNQWITETMILFEMDNAYYSLTSNQLL